MDSLPLGRCINKQCDGCVCFFPAGTDPSANPLAQKCLCGHYGMQHERDIGSGGAGGAGMPRETPSVRHIDRIYCVMVC